MSKTLVLLTIVSLLGCSKPAAEKTSTQPASNASLAKTTKSKPASATKSSPASPRKPERKPVTNDPSGTASPEPTEVEIADGESSLDALCPAMILPGVHLGQLALGVSTDWVSGDAGLSIMDAKPGRKVNYGKGFFSIDVDTRGTIEKVTVDLEKFPSDCLEHRGKKVAGRLRIADLAAHFGGCGKVVSGPGGQRVTCAGGSLTFSWLATNSNKQIKREGFSMTMARQAPIPPQARPVIAWLTAVNTNDPKYFRRALSARKWADYTRDSNGLESLWRLYGPALRRALPSDLSFKYEGSKNRGRVTLLSGGNPWKPEKVNGRPTPFSFEVVVDKWNFWRIDSN